MAPVLFGKVSVGSFLLLSISFLLLPACGKDKSDARATADAGKGRPSAISADVYVVTTSAYSPTITIAGRLLPNEETDVTPEVGGKVVSINFQEGSFVSKGQTLVTLNDADLRAEVRKLQAQRDLQTRLSNRQAELVAIGGISRQEYDATRTGISVLNADLAALQAQLARMRVVAPFSGRIGLRSVSVGAVVGPGTAIARLQQNNPLKLEFSLPDQYRETMFTGKTIPFTIAGLQDSFGAKVYAIEPGAAGATASIRVRARVENANNRLAPGSVATLSVSVGQSGKQSIIVPSQCVIPTTRDRKVMLVKDGKVSPATVLTGDRTNAGIQILSGLRPGDTILATGMMQAKPGMAVTARRVVGN